MAKFSGISSRPDRPCLDDADLTKPLPSLVYHKQLGWLTVADDNSVTHEWDGSNWTAVKGERVYESDRYVKLTFALNNPTPTPQSPE